MNVKCGINNHILFTTNGVDMEELKVKTWICSDHHFNHKNIIKYQPLQRGGFNSIDEMNDEIIRRHNSVVSPTDIVWFLGDISFGGSKKLVPLIERMNGIKHFVLGNHDGVFKSESVRNQFESIQKYKELKFNDIMLILFHFPIRSWNGGDGGAIHFYGHLHSDIPTQYGRSFEICIDGNDLYPYDLELLVDRVKNFDIIGRTGRSG